MKLESAASWLYRRWRGVALGLSLLTISVMLDGCVSDRTLSSEERHRAWVCQHPQFAKVLALSALLAAKKIANEELRKATVDRAQMDLAIAAECPKASEKAARA